jgi:hypothetical protein
MLNIETISFLLLTMLTDLTGVVIVIVNFIPVNTSNICFPFIWQQVHSPLSSLSKVYFPAKNCLVIKTVQDIFAYMMNKSDLTWSYIPDDLI